MFSATSISWLRPRTKKERQEISTITFTVAGKSEAYIDMSKTLLHFQVNPADGTILPAAAVLSADVKTIVTPGDDVNLIPSRLFRELHVSLGDRSVTLSPQNYPYKAMFQTSVMFGGPATSEQKF